MSAEYYRFEQDKECCWSQTQPEQHRYYPGVQNDDESYAIQVDFDGGSKKGRLLVVGLHDGNLMKNGQLDVIHKSELHGQSGVYFYMRHLEGKQDHGDYNRPHVYAGQAAHLGSRAGNKTRLKNKNIVVFIGLQPQKIKNSHYDLNEMLDENWRQHLEHLMIRWLYEQSICQSVSVENGRSEHASKASGTVAKDVKRFFGSMIEALEPLEIWGLSTGLPYSSKGSKLAEPTWRNKREPAETYEWAIGDGLVGSAEYFKKDSVGVKNSSGRSVGLHLPQIYLVEKDSYAVFKKELSNGNPQGGIDLKLLYFKESLLDSKSVEIEKQNDQDVLRFQVDVLLSNITEFKSVVFHNKDKKGIKFQQ